jgi:GlpG protein
VSDKLIDIRAGQVWRIVTPALLHGNAMHLAFNVVMFWQLATMIEYRRGTLTLAWLMLAMAIPSNLAQALLPEKLGGTVFFVGLSGVVFGLLGYLWMKSRFDPASGMFISQGTIFMAFVFLALGFAGMFNAGGIRIANWCHGVGFVTGILIGWVPVAIKNGFRIT